MAGGADRRLERRGRYWRTMTPAPVMTWDDGPCPNCIVCAVGATLGGLPVPPTGFHYIECPVAVKQAEARFAALFD